MTHGEIERLLAIFAEKAEPLGVSVRRAASTADGIASVLDWIAAADSSQLVAAEELVSAAPGFVEILRRHGVETVLPTSLEATRDAPVGASLALMAIAETGSTLLSEPTLADRSIGLLCLNQLIVCPTSKLAASLDDAAPEMRRLALAGASMSTLVTGPSRTADIERVLTVGVQGPGRVCVLFVDELRTDDSVGRDGCA